MPTIDIQKRNSDYIDNLGNNLEFLLHYLTTMAKFHKYSANDLASISIDAPQTFSAVASPDVWQKHFKRTINKNAKGIDIVRNGKTVKVYDVSDTQPPNPVALWQYNDSLHKRFLDAVVPGDSNTVEKIKTITENLFADSGLSDEDKHFAALASSIVILERLNLNQNNSEPFRQEIEKLRRNLAVLPLLGRDFKILTDTIQKNSQKVLDAFQKSVQSFSADVMYAEYNPPDFSLPEKNPLLKILGVIEPPEVNQTAEGVILDNANSESQVERVTANDSQTEIIVEDSVIPPEFQNLVTSPVIDEDDSTTLLKGKRVLISENFSPNDSESRKKYFFTPLENLATSFDGKGYTDNEYGYYFNGYWQWEFVFNSRLNAHKFVNAANFYLNKSEKIPTIKKVVGNFATEDFVFDDIINPDVFADNTKRFRSDYPSLLLNYNNNTEFDIEALTSVANNLGGRYSNLHEAFVFENDTNRDVFLRSVTGQTLQLESVTEDNFRNFVAPALVNYIDKNYVVVLVGEKFYPYDRFMRYDEQEKIYEQEVALRRDLFIRPLEKLAEDFNGEWYSENEYTVKDGFRLWRFIFDSSEDAKNFVAAANSYLSFENNLDNEKVAELQTAEPSVIVNDVPEHSTVSEQTLQSVDNVSKQNPFAVGVFIHTKTDRNIPSAKLNLQLKRDDYLQVNYIAKNYGGSYSRFAKQFLFNTAEDRDAFVKDAMEKFFTVNEDLSSAVVAEKQDDNVVEVAQSNTDISVTESDNVIPAEFQNEVQTDIEILDVPTVAEQKASDSTEKITPAFTQENLFGDIPEIKPTSDELLQSSNLDTIPPEKENPFSALISYTNEFNKTFADNYEYLLDENGNFIDIIDKKSGLSTTSNVQLTQKIDNVESSQTTIEENQDIEKRREISRNQFDFFQARLEKISSGNRDGLLDTQKRAVELFGIEIPDFVYNAENTYQAFGVWLGNNIKPIVTMPDGAQMEIHIGLNGNFYFADANLSIQDNFEVEEHTQPKNDNNSPAQNDNSYSTTESNNETVFQKILTEDSAHIRGYNFDKNIFRKNLLAIRTLQRLEDENRLPNSDELSVLQDYQGFGAIPKAFDKNNPDWNREAWLLHSAISGDDYISLRASTLNAHYTPDGVIQAIYNGLEKLGFEGGNILEPSLGAGGFFKNLPTDMEKVSNLFGVELDSITGSIAKKIYPNAEISVKGFEETTYLNDSFDLALSNVPFGNYKVNDKAYNQHNFLIHDYFIAKMIDQVRPGGIVAVISSKGTMDKLDSSARKYFARRADLVRAFRLPNTAQKNANTSVTTDLLFFKKLDKPRDLDEDFPRWVYSVSFEGDREISVNQYFVDNPNDVIGTLAKTSSPYGFDLTCKPDDNRPLVETLQTLTDTFQKIYQPVENLPTPKQVLPDDIDYVQPLSFFVEDNRIKFFDGKNSKDIKVSVKDRELILHAIELRDNVRNVLNLQVDNCTDAELADAQSLLKLSYDTFVSKFGHIQDNATLKKVFKEDSSYYLLRSLELFDKDKNFIGNTEIFTERTVSAHQPPTHAENLTEALAISMQEQGKVSIDFISSLTEKTMEEVTSELEFDKIYFDFTANEYKLAEEFLSGNIRQKIDDLHNIISNIDNEIGFEVSKNLLPTHNSSHYQPKNDIETRILSSNPTHDFYFDFADDSVLKNYIIDNQDNFDLMAHVARLQGRNVLDGDISQLIYQRPLEMLEAVHHLGRRVSKHLWENSDDVSNFIYKFAAAIDQADYMTAVVEYYGDERNLPIADKERRDLLFAFLHQKLAPFELNPSLIRDNSDYSLIYTSDIKNQWLAFQDKYLQDKQSAIQNFDFEHSEKFFGINERKEHIQKNLAALEKVKPKDLSAADIHVELGASWIPTSDIEDFLCETFNISRRSDIKVNFAEITSAWQIEGKGRDFGPKSEITFGVENYMNALALTENALNGKQSKIYKTVYVDGDEKRVLDDEKTIVAQQKSELIRQEFQNWIFKDEERKNRLVNYYNRHFNAIRPRQYDGSHLNFEGMNTKIKLRDHQKNAIAHTLYGGNTLLAHCVGAGKTFEMVASAMEAKRLGLAQKSMFVVPKHLTEQFGTEFLQLYPNAKILVATAKDFSTGERKEFCSRIASQNWDAVILSFEQFGNIPISKVRKESLLRNQVNELAEAIEELHAFDGNSFTIKQSESMRKKLRAQLDSLQKDNTDQTVTFEQLGIDRLYVDEAHYFKNLYIYSKMGNIPGINTTNAKKTSDLLAKCQYLNEKSNGKCSLIFSTATPLSNSMTELYTMQYYLNPEGLRDAGFKTFDSWAKTFGKIENVFELAPEGTGFRYKIRFSKFHNLPELMNMFKETADIKTADELNLGTPQAEFVIEKIQPSDEQKDIVASLATRADAIHHSHVDPQEDNMLKITNDGRKLALDQRLIDPDLPDDENGKVNRCVQNVFDIYNETADNKSAQLVFCDISTPSDKFNVYDDFKEKLITKGVPADEIAFIHDYPDEKDKAALFEKVRKGEVRILMGSTAKMGTGMNVQDKLIALHDLDVPWRPSDLEQRAGRIIRQGNENKNVKIFRYVTEGTFDAYLWQIIENKQRFISQIMTSKTPARVAEDVDEATLSYSEIKALATGNPLVKEKMEIELSLKKLQTAKSEFLKSHEHLADKVNFSYPQAIQEHQNNLKNIQSDINTVQNNTVLDDNGVEIFSVTLNNKIFTDKKDATKFLADILKLHNNSFNHLHGVYKGLHFFIEKNSAVSREEIILTGDHTYSKWASLVPGDNLKRIAELTDKMPDQLAHESQVISDLQNKIEVAKVELNSPFPQETEIEKLSLRAAQIDALLNLDSDQNDQHHTLDEKDRRLNNIFSFEPKTFCQKKFFALVKHTLAVNNNVYSPNSETLAVQQLLAAGCSRNDIADTLFKFSPIISDQEEIKKIVRSAILKSPVR